MGHRLQCMEMKCEMISVWSEYWSGALRLRLSGLTDVYPSPFAYQPIMASQFLFRIPQSSIIFPTHRNRTTREIIREHAEKKTSVSDCKCATFASSLKVCTALDKNLTSSPVISLHYPGCLTRVYGIRARALMARGLAPGKFSTRFESATGFRSRKE